MSQSGVGRAPLSPPNNTATFKPPPQPAGLHANARAACPDGVGGNTRRLPRTMRNSPPRMGPSCSSVTRQ